MHSRGSAALDPRSGWFNGADMGRGGGLRIRRTGSDVEYDGVLGSNRAMCPLSVHSTG